MLAAVVFGFALLIPVTAIAAGPPTNRPEPPRGGDAPHASDSPKAPEAAHGESPRPSPSASDITELVSGLESDKSQLNALKTKLDGETTVSGAEADVKAIQQFSVGAAAVIARAEVVRASDLILGYCTTRLPTLQTQLAAAIAKAPSGANTTDLNSKLADFKTQVTTACTDAQKAHDAALKATTLADLKAARPFLVDARQALAKASADAHQILAALNDGASPSPEASESPEAKESPKPTPTPTPTPTP